MLGLLGWVPLIPLLGFLILTFGGDRLDQRVIGWVGAGSVGIAALLTALIGATYLNGSLEPYRLILGNWMTVGTFSIPFAFYLDSLSLTMLFVVNGVGFLIHVYAVGYMAGDPGCRRFFAYMNLFVAAMLVLVLADNLVLFYLGWEGVGLCSYLLIGFWYEDPANGYAARKAFVVTRVGDTALALGLFLLFAQLNILDIQEAMVQAQLQWQMGDWLPILVAALLLGGAVGKSAQLPLQTWLPDAMAGPTPVSALIHAATMVTAGVYLIARTHVLFELAPSVQFVVALVGALTLLMSGCSALVQTDIKRILAYSTISQIGYMFLALGVGAWSAAIFHLMTHAFFKALLFMAAGAVILSLHHEQNIFRMGGLWRRLPIAFISFLIGSAALVALPFTAGYASKHEILQGAFLVSPGLWALGSLGALITGIYSFRLVFVVFFGKEKARGAERLGWSITIPLFVLAALSLLGDWLHIPLTSVFAVPVVPGQSYGVALMNFLSLLAPIVGVVIAALYFLTGTFSVQDLSAPAWVRRLQAFWLHNWAMDRLYNSLFVHPFLRLAAWNRNDGVDKAFNGTATLSRRLHTLASRTQNGRLRWYAATMGMGTVVMIGIGLLS